MKSSRYMTRALQSSDPRYARVLGKLGYASPKAERIKSAKAVSEAVPAINKVAPRASETVRPAPVEDKMAALRAQYEVAVGRKPFMGWDAETLKAKIAEAGRYQRRDMRAGD